MPRAGQEEAFHPEGDWAGTGPPGSPIVCTRIALAPGFQLLRLFIFGGKRESKSSNLRDENPA